MKKYSKPELEIFDVQVADYCATVDISGTEIDSSGAKEGLFATSGSIKDDLND